MDDKFDKIQESLQSIDKTLVKQSAQLEEHMRRTELAEESIKELGQALQPMQRHVALVEGGLKAVVAIGGALGLAFSLIQTVRGLF